MRLVAQAFRLVKRELSSPPPRQISESRELRMRPRSEILSRESHGRIIASNQSLWHDRRREPSLFNREMKSKSRGRALRIDPGRQSSTRNLWLDILLTQLCVGAIFTINNLPPFVAARWHVLPGQAFALKLATSTVR